MNCPMEALMAQTTEANRDEWRGINMPLMKVFTLKSKAQLISIYQALLKELKKIKQPSRPK